MTNSRIIYFAAAMIAIFLTLPCRAQSDSADSGNKSDQKGALADRQAVVGDRVKRLEDRMFQLAQILKKTEPEKAKKLIEGLGALRDEEIGTDVGAIVTLLRDGDLADATDKQTVVEEHMRKLLKLLLDDTGDLEEERAEMERLEQLRKALKALTDEQRKQKERAEAELRDAQITESLEKAADQVRDILERQRTIREAQNQASLGDRADAQAALRGETESLAEQLNNLSQILENVESAEGEAGDSTTPPNDGSMHTPGDQSGDSSESANGESSDSSDASPSEDSSSKSGKPSSKSVKETSEKIGEASDKMRSAEQSLRESSSGAESDQAEAEKRLEEALDKLSNEIKERRNKLSLKDDAEAQKELAEKSRELLEEMKGESESSESGGEGESSESSQDGSESEGSESGESGQSGQQNQQGGQGQQNQQSGPPTPGQKPLEEAIPFQDDAAEKFEQDKPEEGVESQKKALEKLEQAREDLEEQLEQMRREQQEQMLAALESRMRAMLSRQVEVNKATVKLSDKGVENWDRKDQLELAEVAEKQRWVGDQADEALFLLTEEGSTVVLPPLIEQVREDAGYVANQLATTNVGQSVLLTQADLEQVLRDIIDAVVRQQEELQQGGGGGGGGGGSSPLLPGSAELKLLRSCQIRINGSTEKMLAELEINEGDATPLKDALERLANKQKDVAEMAKNMHESLSRAQ